MNKSWKRTSVWVPVGLAIAFAAGLWIGHSLINRNSTGYGVKEKINAILTLIDRNYVDEVDTDSLLEKSIPDILAKLDPHTVYIPVEELQGVNEDLDGKFSGIGIQFNMQTDTITVIEVISGGPSEKVGIMAGDRIITINDSVVAGKNISNQDIIKQLRGEEGTKVRLGIKRSTSNELLPYEVTRGDIPVTTVDASYMLDDTTGYIKVNKFGRNTYSEFITSMKNLSDEGAGRYVIDLRGNGGGFMEMAVLMANEFLRAGSPIVFTHGRIPTSESQMFADGTGSFTDSEVVVLIDEFSASASEIFAGAIQDNDRGLIIGRRSFGKGLVQNQTELPDNSAIRLTVGRYYTPSGRCIQKSYSPGKTEDYEMEIVDRYNHGETFNADSIKLDKSETFYTRSGREVYGGGGIMPDIFVPNDTSDISTYYIQAVNRGLMHKFAFQYVDGNRSELTKASSTEELLDMLPQDDQLLQQFVNYAQLTGKLAPRWYYINMSRDLILNQLKALIARDVLGTSAYYEVYNEYDTPVRRALESLDEGAASFPIKPLAKEASDSLVGKIGLFIPEYEDLMIATSGGKSLILSVSHSS